MVAVSEQPCLARMHKIQKASHLPSPPPILSAVYLWPIQKAIVIKSPIKNCSHLAAIALHIWLPLTEVDTLFKYNKRQSGTNITEFRQKN